MKKKTQAHAIISGRVQGVFFRMETKHEADNTGVFGWVRNRSAGTVEAVFEGDEDLVISIIEWCKMGPPRSNVTSVDVKWMQYQDKFEGFEIRY